MGAVIIKYQAEKKQFKDLLSGQYYFDAHHFLCMKINNDDDEGEKNCIILADDGSWELEQEKLYDYVEPVQATLLIEGAE